jgi:hypothetical protein
MIAERQIIRVKDRHLVLDIGENYESFLNRDVEVILFPVTTPSVSKSQVAAPASPWGALRGSIKSIAPDFDTPEDDRVEEQIED